MDNILIFAMLISFSIWESHWKKKVHTQCVTHTHAVTFWSNSWAATPRKMRELYPRLPCNVYLFQFYHFISILYVVIWNVDEPNEYHWHLQTWLFSCTQAVSVCVLYNLIYIKLIRVLMVSKTFNTSFYLHIQHRPEITTSENRRKWSGLHFGINIGRIDAFGISTRFVNSENTHNQPRSKWTKLWVFGQLLQWFSW